MYGMGDSLTAVWRLLSGAGVLAPLLMAVAVVAAGRKHPEFSHRAAFVNELGTDASPWAQRFNAAVTVTGLLVALFAAVVWQLLGAPVVAAGLAVFGAGTLVMGLFPCDPGCPPAPESVSGRVHLAAGILAGLGAVVACLAFGFWAVDRTGAWTLTLYSLVTGGAALALLFTALGALGTGFEGILQRLFLAAVLVWVGVAAGWVFLHAA